MLALKFDVYWTCGTVLVVAVDHRIGRGIHAAVVFKNARVIKKGGRAWWQRGVGIVAGLFAGPAAHAQGGVNQYTKAFPGAVLARDVFFRCCTECRCSGKAADASDKSASVHSLLCLVRVASIT